MTGAWHGATRDVSPPITRAAVQVCEEEGSRPALPDPGCHVQSFESDESAQDCRHAPHPGTLGAGCGRLHREVPWRTGGKAVILVQRETMHTRRDQKLE